jgi:predicted phage terminase large subunit-like protein
VDVENTMYVIDIVRRRMSPSEIINEIFRLRELYEITDIGIEIVAFQKALAYALREDYRYKRQPFHIEELKPQERSKETRIKGLQPLYENGKVYHSRTHPNTLYLEDELLRFPRGTHDDLIDPLSYFLDFIFPSRQKTQRKYTTRYLY